MAKEGTCKYKLMQSLVECMDLEGPVYGDSPTDLTCLEDMQEKGIECCQQSAANPFSIDVDPSCFSKLPQI